MKKFMLAAIKEAYRGIRRNEGGPFGACIVKNGRIIAKEHNTVFSDKDPTCHAEMNAIRDACKKLKSIHLEGCIIYATTEPCPMCFSAIHWARIKEIVYGTSIDETRKLGFSELEIHNSEMKTRGRSPVIIRPNFMQSECAELLKAWTAKLDKKTY